MFKSIGIDNLFIDKRLSKGEIQSLIDQSVHSGENEYTLVWDKAFFSVSDNTIHLNVNIPKMTLDHNVALAEPRNVQEAFYTINRLTDIDFENALITGVHVAYSQEIDFAFSTAVKFCQLPKRGYYAIPKGENMYFNEGSGRKVFAVYDKALHIDHNYPKDIKFEFDTPDLFRAELRVEKQLKKQLAERGLWTLNSIELSDLIHGHAFNSFVKMYESLVDQFLKNEANSLVQVEPTRLADIQKNYFYASLSDSDLWHNFLEKNSKIEPTLLHQIESERTLYLKQSRKSTLIQHIKECCNEVYEKYPVQVNTARKNVY